MKGGRDASLFVLGRFDIAIGIKTWDKGNINIDSMYQGGVLYTITPTPYLELG